MNLENWMPPRSVAFTGLILVVFANICGNVLMKLGAREGSEPAIWLLSWQSILGIALFAAAVPVYAWSLRHVLLHEAQIVVSLQYAGVVIASASLLGERISQLRLAGVALIVAGIVLCMTR